MISDDLFPQSAHHVLAPLLTFLIELVSYLSMNANYSKLLILYPCSLKATCVT